MARIDAKHCNLIAKGFVLTFQQPDLFVNREWRWWAGPWLDDLLFPDQDVMMRASLSNGPMNPAGRVLITNVIDAIRASPAEENAEVTRQKGVPQRRHVAIYQAVVSLPQRDVTNHQPDAEDDPCSRWQQKEEIPRHERAELMPSF